MIRVVYHVLSLSNQGHFPRRVPVIIILEAAVAYSCAVSPQSLRFSFQQRTTAAVHTYNLPFLVEGGHIMKSAPIMIPADSWFFICLVVKEE